MTTPGNPSHPDRISDQQLGQELGVLIAQQASSNLPYSVIFSQLQDLLGDEIALLGPMRDLLGRPALHQLVSLKRHSVQVGARDALLQDLALTYNAGMVVRLADVIDGCLGHPPSSVPPASQQSAYSTQPSSASPSSFNTHRPPQDSPPAAPTNPTPAAMGHPQGFTAAPRNPDTTLLIAVVGILSGALLVGLGWLLLGNQQPPVAPATPAPRAQSLSPQAVGASQLMLRSIQPSWIEVRKERGELLFRGVLEGERRFPLDGGLLVLAGRPDLVQAQLGSGPAKPLGRIDHVRWQQFKAPEP